MNLELFETTPGFFTVIVNGKFADMCTRDEALGVVASALFSKRPIFVRSYESWLKARSLYNDFKPPIALLT